VSRNSTLVRSLVENLLRFYRATTGVSVEDRRAARKKTSIFTPAMVTYMSSDPPAVHTTAFGYEFTRPDIYVPSLSVHHSWQTGFSTTSSARRTALTGSPTRHPDVAAFTSSDPPAVHTTGFGYECTRRDTYVPSISVHHSWQTGISTTSSARRGVDGKQPYSSPLDNEAAFGLQGAELT